MQEVVGIRFKKAGKIYYFDHGEIQLSPGDKAVVETTRGIECGDVVVGPKMVPPDEIVQPLKKVIRKAGPEDFAKLEENRRKEAKAFDIALQKISKHGLPMKLVDVEYTFDGSKIIFYFTAEGRVDFRELVKDLAAVFKTRIELRQIGVRDQAKMIGGLGPCGRGLCCSTFLGDFDPVSIKMAKEQNLSLNPTKISGVCGRLMCCLRFETEQYKESEHQLPDTDDSADVDQEMEQLIAIDSSSEIVGAEEAPDQDIPMEETGASVEKNGKGEETPAREGGNGPEPGAGSGTAKKPRKRRRRKQKRSRGAAGGADGQKVGEAARQPGGGPENGKKAESVKKAGNERKADGGGDHTPKPASGSPGGGTRHKKRRRRPRRSGANRDGDKGTGKESAK